LGAVALAALLSIAKEPFTNLFPHMNDPPLRRSAEHYRQMAAQFRMMAMGEPEGSEVRDKLLEVAAQYERIAEQAQAGRGA
jgi:hypothetical protein